MQMERTMSQITPQDTPEQPKLLSNHVNIKQLKTLLNPDKPASERSVYNEMQRLGVPYVRVLSQRWYDLKHIQAALLASAANREPPKRGRPVGRKAAPISKPRSFLGRES
jgi:hypothetical protein